MRGHHVLTSILSLSEDPSITVGVIEAGPDLCGDPMVASAGERDPRFSSIIHPSMN